MYVRPLPKSEQTLHKIGVYSKYVLIPKKLLEAAFVSTVKNWGTGKYEHTQIPSEVQLRSHCGHIVIERIPQKQAATT
jgi:hypothetical protein